MSKTLRKRINVTRTILWPIRINGEDVPLKNFNLTIEITDPFGGVTELPFEVNDMILKSTWEADKQKFLGPHTLTLWFNKEKSDRQVIDVCKFITLVSRTCVEDSSDSPETILLPTGVIWVGVGSLKNYCVIKEIGDI